MKNEEFIPLRTAAKVTNFDMKVTKRIFEGDKKPLRKRDLNSYIDEGMAIIESEEDEFCMADNLALQCVLKIVESLIRLKKNLSN